jgi:hypothetical protein
MDELYKLVSTKTGLPHDQAKMAVDTVIDFIKKKLPAPVAAQIDAALAGQTDLGAAGDLLGGLFSGKK